MILTRFWRTDIATFGCLQFDAMRLATCENHWADNQSFISCIPVGEYVVEMDYYNQGGYRTLGVKDVIDRTEILVHIGNRPRDTEGCILVARWFKLIESEKALDASRLGHADLIRAWDAEPERIAETLEIREAL